MNNRTFNMPALGLTLCGFLFASFQIPQPTELDELTPYITDPTYEILDEVGMAGMGPLVFATLDTRVYLGIWAEEREEDPGGIALEQSAPKTDPKDYVPDIVENVIHWTIRRNPQVAGKDVYDWEDEVFDLEVPYKLRDVVRLSNGEALTLGTTKKGETIIDSWVFKGVNGLKSDSKLWLPVEKFSRSFSLTKNFDLDLKKPDGGLGPIVRRKIVKSLAFPGEPVAMDAYLPNGTLFLLTRDTKTKATTLRKIETRKGWAETVLKTSAQLPSLAVATEVGVYPVGKSTGYLLGAWGVGFWKMVDGRDQVKLVSTALCLEDLNGDGTFETEQSFENELALHRYHNRLK